MRRNTDLLSVIADKLVPLARESAHDLFRIYAKLLPEAVSCISSLHPYLAPTAEADEYGPFLPLTEDEITLCLKPYFLLFEPDEVSVLYQTTGRGSHFGQVKLVLSIDAYEAAVRQ